MNAQRIDKPDLRRTILDTSRHMLVTEGFEQLSMRKIAKEVGCSATSIYLHFDNKDALLHTLIDEGFEAVYEQVSATVRQGGSAVSRLRKLCHTFIDFGLKNSEYYEIMFMIHPRDISRYPAENYRRAIRPVSVLMDTLKEGIREKNFAIDNPELMAHVIWASMHGVVSALLANRLDIRIDQNDFINLTISNVMRGIASKSISEEVTGK